MVNVFLDQRNKPMRFDVSGKTPMKNFIKVSMRLALVFTVTNIMIVKFHDMKHFFQLYYIIVFAHCSTDL